MLHLHNFQKSYGERPILTIPNWQLPPGIHWLKGPNGAGKTTLFRSIAGMLPHEGSVRLNELDSRLDGVAYRLKVNYAEAEPTFPPFLTAHELIMWVANAKQAPAGQAEVLIDAFGIGTYQHTPVSTYSSGMLKKTSLIMAFLGQPTLILLDEPLVTLDVAATQTVADLIHKARFAGVNFLLSSHQAMETAQLPIDSIWQVADETVTPATV
ncbi:ABC transporter ATP-binding protein [Fibrivirga algicola]|uniref:ABC transporter ATP-binding protein n=1 Tax=Fibrivirga algicola TaxID=2950420 RepID=A0ABX0QKT5_9BACT|nr:ABC transporter ATP-binding protein [Fibrivirga algicola]NID11760.1 ABC transporter ATP-binding protein [Fibrivirga algicola]